MGLYWYLSLEGSMRFCSAGPEVIRGPSSGMYYVRTIWLLISWSIDRTLRGQELSIKGAASNFARFFDVSAWDYEICYGCRLLSKYCLSNPLNYTYDCSFSLKKLHETKVVEQLFEINYVTRKIKWLCNVQH